MIYLYFVTKINTFSKVQSVSIDKIKLELYLTKEKNYSKYFYNYKIKLLQNKYLIQHMDANLLTIYVFYYILQQFYFCFRMGVEYEYKKKKKEY